jgi:WhiB family redox-sensing transcriptional regulator
MNARIAGPLQGHLPSTGKAVVPRTSGFQAPHESDPQWRSRAACRGEDPDRWFPMGSTGPALLQIEDAKAFCRRCPSAGACLSWAWDTGQTDGIWGGLTPEERAALKRRVARVRQKAASDGVSS